MSHHVSQWITNSRDFASRASARTSIATLHRPWTSHSRARPSISYPTDFRKYGGVDGIESMMEDAPEPIRRRRSFRPLELSIYLPDGRLSPLPDFSTPEWSALPAELGLPAQALIRDRDSRTNSISSNPSTSSYLIQRRPVGTGSRRSSAQSSSSISGPLHYQEEPTSRPDSMAGASVRRSSTHSSVTSPRRGIARLPSPSRNRSNTEPTRLLSPSGRGSVRKPRADVDEAIRELNTIVEERRAEAYRATNQSPAFIRRPPPSPSHHVPAIAPSLRMHVRSETLSDIGSAFSAPLASKPLPTPPPPPTAISSRGTKLSLTPPERSLTGGPLTSNPITPPTPTVPTPTTPIGRFGAWLKRSLPSTPTSASFFRPSSPQQQQPCTPGTPFYQCTPPTSRTANSSRPSTAGSRTIVHNRQDSNETATVTLMSYPSTPSLSSRSPSLDALQSYPSSPPTPGTIRFDKDPMDRGNILKGSGKARKTPMPLNLDKEKEIEAGLGSATHPANRGLKPPKSPAYEMLKGMEIPISPNAPLGSSPISPVGVAF